LNNSLINLFEIKSATQIMRRIEEGEQLFIHATK